MLTDFSQQHSDRDRSPRGRRDLAGSRIQEHSHAEHVPAGVSEETVQAWSVHPLPKQNRVLKGHMKITMLFVVTGSETPF